MPIPTIGYTTVRPDLTIDSTSQECVMRLIHISGPFISRMQAVRHSMQSGGTASSFWLYLYLRLCSPTLQLNHEFSQIATLLTHRVADKSDSHPLSTMTLYFSDRGCFSSVMNISKLHPGGGVVGGCPPKSR